jgi:hypothetical protein
VANAVPFHPICEEETKFKPVTDNVNPAPPALAEVGESPVTLGDGLPTVKLSAVDVPPPGAGLTTVTLNEPAVFRSEVGSVACTCVPDTYVVFNAAPLHCTVEELIKPLPFTVSATAAPPRIADWGLIDVTAGTGLGLAPPWPELYPPPQPMAIISREVIEIRTAIRKLGRHTVLIPREGDPAKFKH